MYKNKVCKYIAVLHLSTYSNRIRNIEGQVECVTRSLRAKEREKEWDREWDREIEIDRERERERERDR